MRNNHKYKLDIDDKGLKNRDLSAKLELWRDLNIKTNMLIVHCINTKYYYSSDFMTCNAENVINRWDVFSGSLITRESKLSEDQTISYTGMYSDLGFVLDVKPQNILGTHNRDVYFDTHIGTAKHGRLVDYWHNSKDSWKLADSIFSGRGKNLGLVGMTHDKDAWPIKQGMPYNVIESPRELLLKSNRMKHNEILIIGKPGVSLYHGYPPTQAVKIKALIVNKHIRDENLRRKTHSVAEKIYEMNPNIEHMFI